jgi:hypothetical protein
MKNINIISLVEVLVLSQFVKIKLPTCIVLERK